MFQRYIVRIIFMVPVYCICSFASLMAEDAAIYIITIRDWCVEPQQRCGYMNSSNVPASRTPARSTSSIVPSPNVDIPGLPLSCFAVTKRGSSIISCLCA